MFAYNLLCLQASLPMAPGRLPCGLTQLVLSPFKGERNGCSRRGKGYEIFCRHDLPALRGLRHLAFHGLLEFGEKAPYLCLAAGALPHLISLHLVRMLMVHIEGSAPHAITTDPCIFVPFWFNLRPQYCGCGFSMQVNCDMCILPTALSALSHVQLLNLSDSHTLRQDGCSTLARAPLHQVLSTQSFGSSGLAGQSSRAARSL